MNERGGYFQKRRKIVDTTYHATYSFPLISILRLLLNYKFISLVLYTVLQFLLLIHFCMDAGGFINKVNAYLTEDKQH